MKPAAWRVIALSCIALAIAFVCYQPMLPQRDDYGLTTRVAGATRGEFLVLAVQPGSQAAHEGIHPGDRVRLGDTPGKVADAAYALPGTRVKLVVNNSRSAIVTAHPMPPVGDWTLTLVRLAFLLVAGLLAWRRPENPASRSLVFLLWCYGVAIALANGLTPWPILTFSLQIGDGILFVLGTGAAAAFAANFPSQASGGLALAMSRLAQALAVVCACVLVAGEWLARTPSAISVLNAVVLGGMTLISLLVLATFAAAYVQGAPGDRQRRRWVFLIVVVAMCGFVADAITSGVTGHVVPWLDRLAVVPLGMLPLGLAYVILRHRVIDVGFVLNRAAVYTGVSLVIVGVFVIVETLLGKYVEHTSHVTSAAVQLAVALALGFSIRYVHERVDRFVDSVLFRERHLAEAAIREYAHDASYITDAGVLLSRCVSIVERCAKARGAGVWVREGEKYHAVATSFAVAPDVDENDAAALAMRARRVRVHVRESGSALPGVLAFPMIVRGDLVGMLVCGQKVDDETYAPDEQDALAFLAGSVGHALDAIEIRELRVRLDALTAGGSQPAL